MGREGSENVGTSRWSIMDFLAVGGVLLLLLSLALPAVGYLRESARWRTCSSRLQVLGTALHSYHDSFGCYPMAARWGSEGLDFSRLTTHEDPTPVQVTRDNWVISLLPYLDQASLYDQFDRSVPVISPVNQTGRTTDLDLMRCPSDPFSQPDNQYELLLDGQSAVHFARGNYAINAGSEYTPMGFGSLANPDAAEERYVFDEQTREFQWWGNGIAGINKCFSQRDMVNGLSTTVALEEIRAGIDIIDPRGTWAFGQIGGSITWGHGVTSDDGGPNYQVKDTGPDDILGGPALYKKLGKEYIEAEGMGACDHCNENAQATARSKHDQGVNVLMLDGSVRFVANNIETTLWHVLHSRETPPAVFESVSLEEELAGRYELQEALVAASHDSEDVPATLTNSLGMAFRRAEAGQFEMGLPNLDNKFPFPEDAVPHTVEITRDYLLGIHEVTQAQYQSVMGANPSWHTPDGKFADRVTVSDTSSCPVDNVSWEHATEFCRRLSERTEEVAAGRSYRLPTEAEWERACRAGVETPIPQSPDWDSVADDGIIGSKDDKQARLVATSSVGSFPPNEWGFHDMCGNVYEWTADYRRTGYYEQSSLQDPQGPRTGFLRVIRGWYWVATGPKCKVYVGNDPWVGNPFIGFRVVCEVAERQ